MYNIYYLQGLNLQIIILHLNVGYVARSWCMNWESAVDLARLSRVMHDIMEFSGFNSKYSIRVYFMRIELDVLHVVHIVRL